MAFSYWDREREYRKRLLIISPIAAALVILLFVTSDVVPYDELENQLGWEGATQLLPNITIIPDMDTQEQMMEESRLRTMASMDLDIVDNIPSEGGVPQEEELEPEKETTPELDFAELRDLPTHSDIPYSEDYVIIHMVQPDYPPVELINGIEGDVTVEILVNEEGLVENAWVLAAMGSKSFEAASLEAVKQFRFKPPIQDGKPVSMWIRFQIRFRLLG